MFLFFGGWMFFQCVVFYFFVLCFVVRVVLVLFGCGVYDGIEIYEVLVILVYLSCGGVEVQIFVFDVFQMYVIDYIKGQLFEGESRNVLIEFVRIVCGKIIDLVNFSVVNYDVVIFLGGFGVVKNLSMFVVDGKDCKVNKEVECVLKEFYQVGKFIGLCCIVFVFVVKVFRGVEVIVGYEQEEGGKWFYVGIVEVIKVLGVKYCVKEVVEVYVDQKNKVVMILVFMCEMVFYYIYDGIGVMVRKVLEFIGK